MKRKSNEDTGTFVVRRKQRRSTEFGTLFGGMGLVEAWNVIATHPTWASYVDVMATPADFFRHLAAAAVVTYGAVRAWKVRREATITMEEITSEHDRRTLMRGKK